MTYPKTKTEIVKLLVDQLKDDPDFPWKDKPYDKVVFEWFVTGRAGSGLRLSDAGKVAFEYAKIAHYEFEFSPPGLKTRDINAWHKYALVLDKKIKCPYYIGVKQVDKSITESTQKLDLKELDRIAREMTDNVNRQNETVQFDASFECANLE